VLRRTLGLLLVLLVFGAGPACRGPGTVRYGEGRCFIDGVSASLPEVEAQQAQVTERMQSRQPLLVLVTILVVVLGGMSHIEKLVLLFSTRGPHARGLAEGIRAMLDRYRAHPVRYFSIVSVTLGLLVLSGAAYIYLDADKRASERALGMLEFCHLALRTADEQRVLGEQKHNLEAIQSTASDIRTMVDKLPPEEQNKARAIVDQMNAALAHQGALVGDYAARSEESSRFVKEHALSVEKGLSELGAELSSLKSVPAGVRDLTDGLLRVQGGVGTLDGRLAKLEARFETEETVLAAIRVAAERERPCPACNCSVATSTAIAARR
jgi:hypothetical protein